jgi:hypothetical protein
VSDNAEFAPWYVGDDFSAGTGTTASGSGAILVVSPANFSTIQQAINAASPGNTIQVFPGPYDERIVINKSVILLGATHGISKKEYAVPAEYAYDPVHESIISPSVDRNEAVIQVRLGQITLDGFIVASTMVNQYPEMLYPYTDLITLNNLSNNYTDVRIQNNVIGPNTNVDSQDGTKGRSGVVVTGPSSRTVYNLTIADNRIFDAKGDGCGILLLGSINTSAAPGLPGKYAGSVIDNNTLSGNHRSGIEFAGGVQGGPAPEDRFRITNNTIAENGWRDKRRKTRSSTATGLSSSMSGPIRPVQPAGMGFAVRQYRNNR